MHASRRRQWLPASHLIPSLNMPRGRAAKRIYGGGHTAVPTVERTRGARPQEVTDRKPDGQERYQINEDKIS